MKIRMYGTRGIVPSPGWNTQKYGGNTSCIALRLEDMNDIVIIDAGTGIIKLGQELVTQRRNYNIKIFLTHVHLDHIQGLTYFLPLYDSRNQVTLYFPGQQDLSVDKIFKILTNEHINPIYLGPVKAKITVEKIQKDPLKFKTIKIKNTQLNHPVKTLGFRIEHRGKILVIATDHEPYDSHQHDQLGDNFALMDNEYGHFINNADILIADGQYLPDEVKMYRGWGHANLNYVINQAVSGNVKKLVITHHDPNRSDRQIDTILDHYRKILNKKNIFLELIAAKEVDEYIL